MKISVVIPTYNSASYLNECIDSILNQTFQDFEIVIVDDGSTDNTIDIIKSYNDQRIKLICNDHNYIQSLNIGMTKARGKYIARMDSDDIMMPERLQIQYEYMETHPEVDVCGGFAQCFGDSNKLMTLYISHIDIVSGLIFHNTMAHPTVMIKRKLISQFPKKSTIYQCYDPNYRYAEDYKLWTDLAIKGYHFTNIPSVIIKYRISDNQITTQNYDEMMKCSIKISAKYIETIEKLIINEDKAYEAILNETIKLYNREKIEYDMLQNIFYAFCKYIFHNRLKNKEIFIPS